MGISAAIKHPIIFAQKTIGDNNKILIMDTPGLRLKTARSRHGFKSARSAALHYGWPPSTYTAHESGGRGYDLKYAQEYANRFDVTASWLMTGENPPNWLKRPAKANKISQIIKVSQIETAELPVLGYNHLIELTHKKIYLSDINSQKDVIRMILKEGYSDAVVVVRVEDNLNFPSLKPMDFVIVDLEQKPVHGKRVVAILKGYDTPVIARLQQDLYNGQLVDILRFDNNEVQDIVLEEGLCLASYLVIGMTVFD